MTNRCKHGLIPETCGICQKDKWAGRIPVKAARGIMCVDSSWKAAHSMWGGEDRVGHRGKRIQIEAD